MVVINDSLLPSAVCTAYYFITSWLKYEYQSGVDCFTKIWLMKRVHLAN